MLINNVISPYEYDKLFNTVLMHIANKLKVDVFDIFEIGKDEYNRLTVKIINKELFK